MGILKKIFIVSTVLFLVLIVFFGIYLVAFKKDAVQRTEKQEVEEYGIEEVFSEKLTNITSDAIISATIGPDKNTIRYYSAADGRLWTMTLRGANKEVIKNANDVSPQSAEWSPGGDSAILTYGAGKIEVHNHSTNTTSLLRSGMDYVSWAGGGGKILYKYFDQETGERSLNIANADGSGWKKITDLPYRFVDFVQIPSSIFVAFWPTADINQPSEIRTANTVTQNAVKTIYSGVPGSDYLFSPDGKSILVSMPVNGGSGIRLGIMDGDGSNFNDLIIPTIVKKAVWSEDGRSVYYALPNDVPANVVWPNDYQDRKFFTQDTLFKLDVATGKKTRIIELDEIQESVDAINLFLSPAEDYLYFTNRKNNLLYRLNL